MKQFKLIKEYPNSPEVGAVAEAISYGGYFYNGHIYSPYEIENFPEFWTPVGAESKYKSLYNAPQNIGTVHWFNTLVGTAKSQAEYMIENGMVETYPQFIFDVLTDLVTAQKEGLIRLRP